MAPAFFIPFISAEEYEKVYTALAGLCHCPVPSPGNRIYSITFKHNGEEWAATVGKLLEGVGAKNGDTRELSDNATVMAIFPGNPYFVCTDNNRTRWANPFMAGNPHSIISFTSDERLETEHTAIAGA